MPKPVYKKTVKKKVVKKKVVKKKKPNCIACNDTKTNSKGGPCASCRILGWS